LFPYNPLKIYLRLCNLSSKNTVIHLNTWSQLAMDVTPKNTWWEKEIKLDMALLKIMM